jgi:hypothetical protein
MRVALSISFILFIGIAPFSGLEAGQYEGISCLSIKGIASHIGSMGKANNKTSLEGKGFTKREKSIEKMALSRNARTMKAFNEDEVLDSFEMNGNSIFLKISF